ncbi:MAG: DUF4450 domain-containing protein [Planctomycetota bacterium]|nr:DUF4450 domain-containing protein [Planctomycetota bacterium]
MRMTDRRWNRALFGASPFLLSILCASVWAGPILDGGTERPLHYHPDGRDFVVENGKEYFNRPLYGPNTGFRIDAGDKPEFSFYLPGRGGNLRLGITTKTGTKWLDDAEKITARYRPGSMLYDVSDPVLADGVLHLTALPMHMAEGLVIRVELVNSSRPVGLIWAYGGASGERGTRDGDIGTEREPVSRFFQLRAEACKGNSFAIDRNKFTLTSKPAAMQGLAPARAVLAIGDARQWSSASKLVGSIGQPATLSVLVGQYALTANASAYIALARISRPGDDRGELGTYLSVRKDPPNQEASQATTRAVDISRADSLQTIFDEAEKHRKSIADEVMVDTPDPFINAAVPALCVAGDAVWDERQGTYMHGAVAWRSKLLGWRGPYLADEMGRHDRALRDMTYWVARQNDSPIPDAIPPADASANLARNEAALHSNGDISTSHYDMNLVFIDVLFRHILWTGDVEFARKMWPVIQRHLAWEQRLFRRRYGPDHLPLYEAYCCIWASDDLEYSGGGAAHSSAYNYFHNHMAARVAKMIGEDPAPYEQEAALIGEAMRKELWLADRGWFGEYKDLLGEQLVHASPALWTFYHTVDSKVTTPMEAWQMTRFIDTQIAHIPIHGAGIGEEGYFTLPTTNWMFYTWSINNVVMAEAGHTALGYYQANRPDEAFRLLKGCIIDSMYQGLCPGNAGMCTFFDVARGETQRDFADAVGVCSRAVVEGLFGVQPDALAGELTIRPGFPSVWEKASLNHPDFRFAFKRDGLVESYSIEPTFPRPMALRLQAAAFRDQIDSVTLNGQPAEWHAIKDSIGTPRIEITSPPNRSFKVEIRYSGQSPAVASAPAVVALGAKLQAQCGAASVIKVEDPQGALEQIATIGNGFGGIAKGLLGARTVFAKVRQGGLTWWLPVPFEIRPSYEIISTGEQDAAEPRFRIRNNTSEPIDRNLSIESGNQILTRNLKIPAMGDSEEVVLNAKGLCPGTNTIAVDLSDGKAATGSIVNWGLSGKELTHKLEPVDLTAIFNDKVTRIFGANKYLAPRSPFCSLAMPTQGIGSWCRPTAAATIDDTGLRGVADQNHGMLVLPDGIAFRTPGTGDASNIAFVSQWDNYPRQITVPVSGRGSHVYLLMAGSTNWMQSRICNGRVVVNFADGSSTTLPLENPKNWWPIEQDYLIDDYAFRRPEALPIRVDLKTGTIRVLQMKTFKGRGGKIDGGAATVIDLPLKADSDLVSLQVRADSNESVIGLMAMTLLRS